MAIEVCSCGDGSSIQNFGGIEDCNVGVGIPVNVILLADQKVGGGFNGIDIENDTLDATFFDGKFKDPIIKDRWLFLEGLEEFDSPPIDPTVEDFASGTTIKLHDNPKEVTFFILTSEAHKLAAKIKASECRSLSIMYNDNRNSLVGDLQGTSFKGRKIQNGSFDVQVIDGTFGVSPKVQVKFKYDRQALETNVDYIQQTSMGGFSISNDATALVDGDISYGTSVGASSTFSVFNDFGGALTRVPIGGQAAAFEVFNITDDAVEPATITETTTLGTYIATYTAPVTLADVIRIRGIGNVNVQGDFDFKDLQTKSVVTTA